VTERPRAAFRPEIQALRAIAVLSVVFFHLFPSRLTGGYVGVDVFFVISGFLITSHLMRDIGRPDRPPMIAFWVRRVRRLLPAAFLVLAVTWVGVVLIAPVTLWRQFLTEIAASAVYVENWVLAVNSVDYFAAENSASPVQHYWSLSVEEQFYLVWPLLLLLLVVSARRITTSSERRMAIVAGGVVLVLAASLAYSAAVANEPFGYFSTFTHAWEFAAGGLLALVGAPLSVWLGRHATVGSIAAWLGYGLILAAVLTYTGETPFPGVAAIIPVAGVILVMAAGSRPGRLGPDRLAALRPVQWVGDVSYSMYLWHWPPIVLIPLLTGAPLTLPQKLGILAATFGLAWLTKRFVEDRFRGGSVSTRRARAVPLAALAISTTVVVGAAAVPIVVLDRNEANAREAVVALESSECFGASASLIPGCEADHTVNPEIGPAFAKEDTPIAWAGAAYDDCPVVAGVRQCEFGDPDSDTTVALVGDSHVRHYLPAMVEIAERRGWRLLLIWEAGCRPVPPVYDSVVKTEQTPACIDWKNTIGPAIAADPAVDLVLTSAATRRLVDLMPDPTTQQKIAAGFRLLWQEWADAGKSVIVMPDMAVADFDIPDCIAQAPSPEDPCALPRDVALPADPLDAALVDPPVGVTPLDLTNALCDERTCHFVVGGAVTHYDSHHLSSTFARSLEPWIEDALESALAR
jgi:peptidoglycan/LPS O-acetylase OafA/YrhL